MIGILLLIIIIFAVSRQEKPNTKCPYCGSNKAIAFDDKYFYYGTATSQKRPPYKCRECGEIFYDKRRGE